MTGLPRAGDLEKEPVSALHIPTSDPPMRREPALPASLEFDAIYQDHFRFVWSTLLRLGVPRHAVEDASQETFLVVHRRLGDFEGRGSPRAWLFGIARRVAFRVRRSQDRRRRKISALRMEPPSSTPVDDAVAERQLSALLLAALDELDDDKRAALTLHVFEEMSGPQVAEVLGLKVDTAYSRIKAGRRALKRVLGERGVEADVGRLVHATRHQTRPGAEARGRVAGLLAVPMSALSTPAVAGLSWKVIAIAAAVGVAAVGGIQAFGTRPAGPDSATPTAVASEPAEARPEAPAALKRGPARSATAVPVSGPAEPIRPTPPRSGPAKPSPTSGPMPAVASVGLQAEVELIDSATTAVRAGDPSGALTILAEHARRFPAGQLAGERRAVRAVALCSGGKTPQGRAEARLSRAAKPSKALLAWLDSACGPARTAASGG